MYPEVRWRWVGEEPTTNKDIPMLDRVSLYIQDYISKVGMFPQDLYVGYEEEDRMIREIGQPVNGAECYGVTVHVVKERHFFKLY